MVNIDEDAGESFLNTLKPPQRPRLLTHSSPACSQVWWRRSQALPRTLSTSTVCATGIAFELDVCEVLPSLPRALLTTLLRMSSSSRVAGHSERMPFSA